MRGRQPPKSRAPRTGLPRRRYPPAEILKDAGKFRLPDQRRAVVLDLDGTTAVVRMNAKLDTRHLTRPK